MEADENTVEESDIEGKREFRPGDTCFPVNEVEKTLSTKYTESVVEVLDTNTSFN